MSRSFFKANLASSVTQKKPGAQAPITAAPVNARAETHRSSREGSEIYGDVSVCRMLRVHRRVLDAARTQAARGRDWDVVGMHAGMTKEWVMSFAAAHGITPDFSSGHFEPIRANDGVVSVRLVGTHPNPKRCTVEIIATGDREFCSVRDLYQFPIHYKEAFDAMRVGSNLEWVSHLNACNY